MVTLAALDEQKQVSTQENQWLFQERTGDLRLLCPNPIVSEP